MLETNSMSVYSSNGVIRLVHRYMWTFNGLYEILILQQALKIQIPQESTPWARSYC